MARARRQPRAKKVSRSRKPKVPGWIIIRYGSHLRPSPSFWNAKQRAWVALGGTVYQTQDDANRFLCRNFLALSQELLESVQADGPMARHEEGVYGEIDFGMIDVWPAARVLKMYGRIQ